MTSGLANSFTWVHSSPWDGGHGLDNLPNGFSGKAPQLKLNKDNSTDELYQHMTNNSKQ